MERIHEFIFVDEAGFSLTKRRRRGRNIIGQHGGNITLCASTQHLLICHGGLEIHWLQMNSGNTRWAAYSTYVIIRDNVSFHSTVQVREWLKVNQNFINLYLPLYSRSKWRLPLLGDGRCMSDSPTPGLNFLRPRNERVMAVVRRCVRAGYSTLGGFPLLPGKGKYSLWCGWSPVACPSPRTGWCSTKLSDHLCKDLTTLFGLEHM